MSKELAEKILKLRDLHKDVSDKKTRLEGKLEADLKSFEELEKELQTKGIQPQNLETLILQKEEELKQDVEKSEKELLRIKNELLQIENTIN